MLVASSCDVILNNQVGCLFEMGQIEFSSGVFSLAKDEGLDFDAFLEDHKRGNWGQIDKLDVEANELSLGVGGQLFSSFFIGDKYSSSDIWLITDSDRSRTRVLLPTEWAPVLFF